MRPPQRKRRLQFEVMESGGSLGEPGGHSLASPVLVSLPSIPIPPPHEPPVQLVVLQGLLSGSYSAHTFPDVGTTYDLSGKGQVRPFGPMDVTGTLHSLGFIQQGHAGGTLTLSDSQGTLTLQLTGPLQRGSPPAQPVRLRDHGGHRRLQECHRSRDGLPSVGCRPDRQRPGRHAESLGANGPLRLEPGGQLQPATSAIPDVIEFDCIYVCMHQEILQKVRSNDETTTAESAAPVRGDGVAQVLSASLAGASWLPPPWSSPSPREENRAG